MPTNEAKQVNLTSAQIGKILNKNKLVFSNFKVNRFGLFGSYSRGQASVNSDIDLLVEFKETIDLFEYVKLSQVLKKLLKKNIDLVTLKALKPLIKRKILQDTKWF